MVAFFKEITLISGAKSKNACGLKQKQVFLRKKDETNATYRKQTNESF